MLTVMELLSMPLFRNFRLVSGYGGLYNRVSGTGIFEWESSYEVERNFKRGEFVVTTLSLSRGDAALAESSIRMLIDKKVSAVAIKDIYYQEISEELKSYSDERQIPVFFFSDTFFDDIIYTIRNALLARNRDFSRDEQIEFLLDSARSPEQKRKKAREINPFFHSSAICCFGTQKDGSQWQKALKLPQMNPEEAVYSILEYRQGVLVIFTSNEPIPDKLPYGNLVSRQEEKLMLFLEESGLKGSLSGLGISSVVRCPENLGTAIRESLYANASCLIDHLDELRFMDSGLDRILMPAKENLWTKKYYECLLSKLTDYDARHGAKLMETLLEYVKNSGDIKQTAKNLYQHGNTIRYRLEKIRNLLDLGEDGADCLAQLYIFVRLHRIYGM